MQRSPSSIIESKRKNFSLNALEKITGMNRSSVLRYQRGELPVPEDVAEKLAQAFFKKASEQNAFVDLCLKHAKSSSSEVKERRDRRAARTLASRECECVFRLFPEYKTDEKGETHHSGMYFAINVFLTKDNERKKLFTVHSGGYEFWNWGMEFDKTEPERLVKNNAIQWLTALSQRKWNGSYALLDLVTQALREQKDAQHRYGLDSDEIAILSRESLEYIGEQIKKIASYKDEHKRRKTAEFLAADIEALKKWREDVEKSKKKLAKQLKIIESTISHQIQHK